MYMKKRGKKKASAIAFQSDSSDPSMASSPPPPVSHHPSILESDDHFDHRLGDYQLMEGIGKGGYGLVYRGLNVTTGITVAVKRIGLSGIPPSSLDGILQEIKLLEALEHPNIVKYLDSVHTEEHLNIILEYVENGALSSLLARFGGAFPESLVCHYITQVVMGLHYLHQQGVIHRDIKGANILSTKEGLVKLADFGVATKLNESRKSDSVVGTPYWMSAPQHNHTSTPLSPLLLFGSFHSVHVSLSVHVIGHLRFVQFHPGQASLQQLQRCAHRSLSVSVLVSDHRDDWTAVVGL